MILEFLPSFMIVEFLSNSRRISKSIGIKKKLITFFVATFDEDFYRMILSTSETYNNQCRNYILTSFQWARYIPHYTAYLRFEKMKRPFRSQMEQPLWT